MENLATRLKEIPKVERLRADGHAHPYYNYRQAPGLFWIEPGKRDLASLARTALSQGVNAVGLTNFDSNQYEFWAGQVSKLPKDWKYYQDDRVTVVVTPNNKPVYFWKSEEIATKQGHVLVWGGKSGKNLKHQRSLEETLDEADKDACLTKIADHAYSMWHGLRKNLDGKEDRFDAYEWNASTDGNKKVIDKAQYAYVKVKKKLFRLLPIYYTSRTKVRIKNPKPVVAESDAHRPQEIGTSYTEFDGSKINYANGEAFMRSIREQVKSNKFSSKRERASRLSSLHHVLTLGIYRVLGIFVKSLDKYK